MTNPGSINILIACEESQRECIAFRKRGFNAFSCDIQRCSGKHPEWHIMGDVTKLFQDNVHFKTQDGNIYLVEKWHCVIAHPPCTYLCKVSSIHMIQNGVLNYDRYEKMKLARNFFFKCLNVDARFVAVENPLPMARAELPKPSCFIQPSWYGHKYTKKTLFWLKNLPPLMPDLIYPNPKQFVRASRGKYRSRTFPGVAEAMAKQWGNFILDELDMNV